MKGDLGVGQTFVLRVTPYTGDVRLSWNALLSSPRIGATTWVPITIADPFQYEYFASENSAGSRPAADEVFGTPFGRPEDMVISKDKDGREVLYFSATSEHTVYTVVLLNKNATEVKVFGSRNFDQHRHGFTSGVSFHQSRSLGNRKTRNHIRR